MDRELLEKAKTLAARGYQVQVQKEDGLNGTAIWVHMCRKCLRALFKAIRPSMRKKL